MGNFGTVIITGGSGFIGRHLVKKILESKCQRVVVIDNLSNSSWNDFIRFLAADDQSLFKLSRPDRDKEIATARMTFYRMDVRDYDDIERVFETEIEREKENEKEKDIGGDLNACIHLAAKISVPESAIRPEETMDVNVRGTNNVIKCARKFGIQYCVFASSAAVYGIPSKLPISELEVPNPISKYGESKLEAENVLARYSKELRRVISLRLFNLYGIGQTMEYAGVITRFMDRIKRNLPPEIYGNGLQTRDFINVDDVVDAMMRAAGLVKIQENETTTSATVTASPKSSETETGTLKHTLPQAICKSGVYNIGTGIPTKIKDLAHVMTDILVHNEDQKSRLNLRPIYLEPVEGDIYESYADISKARHSLGFVPSSSLRCGLKDILL